MTDVDKRNKRVREILTFLFERASDENVSLDETAYGTFLDELFSTTSWGFREILLVVIVGMKTDSSFRASESLYKCNPRAIYEGAIKEFLIKNEMPHRKSGPLNVAKAAPALDKSWAAQRRPKKAAEQVVKLVQYLENPEKDSNKRIDDVGVSLMRRFIAESNRIKAIPVRINSSADPEFLSELCYRLISEVPDAGNTPQKIAALLLKNYHLSMETGIVITGEADRASVTSTTSKKPGDVNEESLDGTIYKVYEITLKPFDMARIRDSYDSVLRYNKENNSNLDEIVVVCRKKDCIDNMKKSNLSMYLGSYHYRDITYHYVDIYEWVAYGLIRMTQEGRVDFYNDLRRYVEEINTAESVKLLWNQLHE